jgi:23S rRNA (cytosine1962-C5)-methyltransferase
MLDRFRTAGTTVADHRPGITGAFAAQGGLFVIQRQGAAGALLDALRRATGAPAALERPDAQAARREGIPVHQGPLWGDPPKDPVAIRERARCYRVDAGGGQKTGFYLDQRDARDLVQALAPGRRVLDLFAYTGGFSVAAAHGGAQSIAVVESSVEAIETAERHLEPWAATIPLRFSRDDAFGFARSTFRSGEHSRGSAVDGAPLPFEITQITIDATAHKARLRIAPIVVAQRGGS